MTNKKKKIIIIFSALITTFFIISLAVGNYFFDYALARKDGNTSGSKRNIASNVPQHIQETINENKEKQNKIVETWLETVSKQDVSVTSNDGLCLRGTKFLSNNDSHNYAIIVHGYSGNKSNVFDVACHYQNSGYTVITPDLRACGSSDGNYKGMGWLDKNDILKWISLILDEDPEAKIVLHGISMGAATVMMSSGENLPKNVTAIVEDCGYTSVNEVFSSEIKLRFNLPSFPIINCASLVCSVRAKYNFYEASSLEQVKKSTTPILFIHGSSDDFIPVEMCHRLYDAANCQKEILIIDGANHNQSRFLQPEKYYHTVFNFIKR